MHHYGVPDHAWTWKGVHLVILYWHYSPITIEGPLLHLGMDGSIGRLRRWSHQLVLHRHSLDCILVAHVDRHPLRHCTHKLTH